MNKKYVGLITFLTQVKQSLQIKQQKLEEISMDEVRQMWDLMGSNGETIQMDLSWVASKEDIKNVKNDISYLISTVDNILSILDYNMEDPYCAPEDEIIKWNYTLDGNNIILNRYIGSDETVKVYPKYMISGSKYKTKLTNSKSSGNIENNYYMFEKNTSIKQVLFTGNIDISNLINVSYMFNGCSSLTTIHFGTIFTDNNITSIKGLFKDCTSLIDVNLSDFNTSKVIDMKELFNNCNDNIVNRYSELDMSNVENVEYMFAGLNYNYFDIGNLILPKVTKLDYLFDSLGDKVTRFKNLNLLDTSNITSMKGMFKGFKSLNLDLRNLNVSNVTNMSYMFNDSIGTPNLTGWNTTNVTNMSYMFSWSSVDESNIQIYDLTSFDISNVEDMTFMFDGREKLNTVKVSTDKWIVKAGCKISYMFRGCICSEVTYQ